jgi:hypothetical protein
MKTLKNVLLINALSSGATGILLIAIADTAAAIFEAPYPGVFRGVGLFLLAFALLVFLVFRSTTVTKKGVLLVTVLDILWVIVSVLFVIFDGNVISVIGNILIIAVALWVAAMAFFQSRGIKELAA